ncbi:MFS transporter [Stutzerimonas azotifigens]|uniref:MFS transporter n=1 Tax=Stutzerimonas azotifigens TaxID=291995 RepID=A0ABR5Z6E3_9GAMM|nr:MFS transporter [Stutzerimonas azotifigens]MBA1275701.1 MFS transporter [Stutzerimonas azotifigens]
MNLRFCLIAMTALAVVTDNLIIPFYPQYFAERFGNPPASHVGLYLAAISLTVMTAFPFWARLGKRVHPVRILVSAQFIAGSLTAACTFIDSLPLFWVVSLVMIVFKGSYLLMYPYVMSLQQQESHTQTIGTLSVVVHFGAILGAAVGGLILQVMNIGDVFLIMAAGDFIQMAICMHLLRRGLPDAGSPSEQAAEAPAPEDAGGRGRSLVAIYKLCVVMLLFYCVGYITRPFFAVYWQEVARWNSELMAGFVYSLPGAIAVLALWWSRRAANKGSTRDGILAGLLLGAAATFLQGFENQWLILLGRVLFGWALYQVTVRLDALLFELSTPENYAVDFSKVNIFQCLGNMGAAYGAGLLVSHYGTAMPFWVGAAGLVLTALLFPWLVRAPATARTAQA